MIIVENTFTRPSTSVPFFNMPVAMAAEFQQNYRFTGKASETTNTFAADGLSTVVTTKWKARAHFNEFLEDPLSDSMRTARSAYLAANNIQMASNIRYIPTEGDMDSYEISPPAPGSN
jgi:hypothetical protein